MKFSGSNPPSQESAPNPGMRETCWQCRRAKVACYCSEVIPFDPGFDLAICVHPREARNPIGTARIIYRFVQGCELFVGTGSQLDTDPRFRDWINRSPSSVKILYPGPHALWISEQSPLVSQPIRPRIVIIDGTWSQAKQLVRTSELLRSISQIAFQPRSPSLYTIREQPATICLSSLEAVSELISLAGEPRAPGHERMLGVFHQMVDYQLKKEIKNHVE